MNEDKIREAALAAFEANERFIMVSSLNTSGLTRDEKIEQHAQYYLARSAKVHADKELSRLIDGL